MLLSLSAARDASQIRGLALGAIVITTLFLILRSFHVGPQELKSTTVQSLQAIKQITPPLWRHEESAILKVTSMQGEYNELYEGALRSHEEHNKQHGYKLKVLRELFADKYLNTPTYLLSLIVEELAKPEEQRKEWLVYVGPDTMILNPRIPLEIFLPPKDFDGIYFLGTRDEEGFSCGVFMIRVHEWSIKMLTELLNVPNTHPEVVQADDRNRRVFEMVLRSDRFRNHVKYQPRTWYNAYQLNSTSFEGTPVDMLVHFHDLGGDKWSAMADMLTRTAEVRREWSVPLGETIYEREISDYWERISNAHVLIESALPKTQDKVVFDALRRLEYAVTYETDEKEKMSAALLGLRAALDRQGDGGSV